MNAVEQEPQLQATYEADGFRVDEATGEIVELADPMFRVDSLSAAEWVLERMQAAASEVDALQRRQAQILANIEAMKRRAERRLEWLHVRFDQELELFSHQELDGKKTRTLHTPYAALSLRKQPERLKVMDQSAALAWAKEFAPEIVKVSERVLDTDVLARIGKGEDRLDVPWVQTIPSVERMHVAFEPRGEHKE